MGEGIFLKKDRKMIFCEKYRPYPPQKWHRTLAKKWKSLKKNGKLSPMQPTIN